MTSKERLRLLSGCLYVQHKVLEALLVADRPLGDFEVSRAAFDDGGNTLLRVAWLSQTRCRGLPFLVEKGYVSETHVDGVDVYAIEEDQSKWR